MANSGIGRVAKPTVNPIYAGYANQFVSQEALSKQVIDILPIVTVDSIAGDYTIDLTNYALNFQENPNVAKPISSVAPAVSPMKNIQGKMTHSIERFATGNLPVSNLDITEYAARGIDLYAKVMKMSAARAAGLIAYNIAALINTDTNYASTNKVAITGLSASTDWPTLLETGLEAMRAAQTWNDGAPLKITVSPDVAGFIRKSNSFKAHVTAQFKNQDQPIDAVVGYIKQFVPLADVVIPRARYTNASGTSVNMFSQTLAMLPYGDGESCSFGKLFTVGGVGAGPSQGTVGGMFEVGDNELPGAHARDYWTAVYFQAKLAIDEGASTTTAGYLMHSAAA